MGVPEGFRTLRMHGGFLKPLGPFHGRWDGERFVLGVRIAAHHCNTVGICHGGMLATLGDMLLTIGGNLQGGTARFLPTINLSTDFLAPVAQDAWVEGRLEILRTTRTLLFVAGLLETAGQGPVARVSGMLKITGEPDARFSADRWFE